MKKYITKIHTQNGVWKEKCRFMLLLLHMREAIRKHDLMISRVLQEMQLATSAEWYYINRSKKSLI